MPILADAIVNHSRSWPETVGLIAILILAGWIYWLNSRR
jgi:hypothetical protein